ncbi:MAG: heavy-metal-associated domain-containing protein [Nanoarchaeota archaeon]|nr:heavy-metal-associated domain-containing protein [Nanoarchaeota archaeon]
MKNVTLVVDGMHCKSCELLIEDSLKGIGAEKVSFEGSKVNISFDEGRLHPNQIKQVIREEGYRVV